MSISMATNETGISVSLGEIRSVHKSSEVLVAFGLGSCVAICLWEPVIELALMAHVVLPASGGRNDVNPGKFADLALPRMVDQVRSLGGRSERLVVRIAGGASVLAMPGAPPLLQVGDRNVEAVLAVAERLRLHVSARDVGGVRGRTVRLAGASGDVYVRTLGEAERRI